MTVSLRKPEDIELIAAFLQDLMQTIHHRAKRVDQARKVLATLNDDERFGLAAELLGCSEGELCRVLLAGARSIEDLKIEETMQ